MQVMIYNEFKLQNDAEAYSSYFCFCMYTCWSQHYWLYNYSTL